MNQLTNSALACQYMLRLLCWFAAFPYAAYMQLGTQSERVYILVRGISVILSPLVFTLALMSNGTRIVGSSPYLYLLPPVVFCIDWFLIARSYTLAQGTGWLSLLRVLILVISVFMAGFAGLVSESDSLLQNLHRAEDKVTMQSMVAKNLTARIEAIDLQVKENEQKLMSRSAIQAQVLEARRLQDLECHGKSGVDPKTGIFVKGGGKCGANSETYRINAENGETMLNTLSDLSEETKALKEQRDELAGTLNTLLMGGRSPENSMGALFRSLFHEADFGIWAKVIGICLFIMVVEAFAFLMSEVEASPAMRMAVQYSAEIDQIRLQAWRDASHAGVMKQRAAERDRLGDGLAPMEVRLSNVAKLYEDKAFHTTARRQYTEKPEEVV